MLSDSINIAITAIVNYYRDSESALDPATIVGLLAMETAYNQLLVMSFLALTLDIVDLPLPKSV